MDIAKIKLGEKEFPFYFGVNAIEIYDDVTGENFFAEFAKIGAIGEGVNVPMKMLRALAYAGIKDGHRKIKEPFMLTIDDIGDLMDEDLSAVASIFEKLVHFKIFQQGMANEAAKKK